MTEKQVTATTPAAPLTPTEIKKILVPVDGTVPSRHAISMAIYLAQACDAEITLLTVIDLNKHISAFEQVSTGGYIPAEVKEKAYQLQAELMHEIPNSVRAKMLIEIGAPAEKVVEICATQHFDLIILGTRGRTELKSFMLGSVSEYTLHHTTLPVLVVK
ncbi:MAG: universal stress protein [Acidaminococcaceae bacterium]|jgi:nucleotide-binding universal stress UspA family protein|nr:universal stress protein [Acidaminococcaceae bacterium]